MAHNHLKHSYMVRKIIPEVNITYISRLEHAIYKMKACKCIGKHYCCFNVCGKDTSTNTIQDVGVLHRP